MTDTEKNGGEKTESKYKIKWILIFIGVLSACALLGYVILNRTSERPAAEVSVEQREQVPQVPQRTEPALSLEAKITTKPEIISQGTSDSNVLVPSQKIKDSVEASVPAKSYFKTSSNKNFVLVTSTSTLTWKAFIEVLKSGDMKVIEEFDSLFNSLDWDGVLFECKPFKWNKSVSEQVEFRIIKDESFRNRHQDADKYAQYFNESCQPGVEGAVSFKSPSGTTLVAPCPASESGTTVFTHLKVFLRTASPNQKILILQKLGSELEKFGKSAPNRKVWLSTHGHGVFWLHLRVSFLPLYYSTDEYADDRN